MVKEFGQDINGKTKNVIFRKPSRMVRLEVRNEHGANGVTARALGQGIMVRPS